MKFLSFEKARAFIRKQHLKNCVGWGDYCRSGKKPLNIPASPHTVYKGKGWKGLGDWLGTGAIAGYKREFLPFEEARTFVQKLHLENTKEWREYCKSGVRPAYIPANPGRVYRGKGWKNYGDWLGTDRRCQQTSSFNFVSFKKAKAYVKAQKIKSIKEWHAYCQSGEMPAYIPKNPHHRYRNEGWKGFGDFLGTGAVASFKRKYQPYEKAREFARSKGIKTCAEWKKYAASENLPTDIPSHPDETYKNKGWLGWEDWLGNYKTEYRPFEEARLFVHSLGLKSETEWRAYVKGKNKPLDIPAAPSQVYKGKGWKGFGDFLGTGNIATFEMKFLPFKEARAFVRLLKLKNKEAWDAYSKSGNKAKNIPSNPHRTYKNKGWKSYSDWVHSEDWVANYRKEYRFFEEARLFVQNLGLKNVDEWRVYCKGGKKPLDIPAAPSQVYKGKSWKGWGDFLGTGNIAAIEMKFLSFKEARAFVRLLKLKNKVVWDVYSKSGNKPKNIPSNPHRTYKNKGWKGYSDWLHGEDQ